MSIYFTSDWHIGHANILHLANRPFEDINACNEAIISNYQSIVNEDDTVYMIGDICWNYQTLPGVLQRLPGHKILIVGNHDKCFKEMYGLAMPGAHKFTDFYKQAGFEAIFQSIELPIANQLVVLNHFPYRNDNPEPSYDDRYKEQRLVNQGQWLIHGHIHNKGLVKDHMINVSVEMHNYAPVHISEIENIIVNASQ